MIRFLAVAVFVLAAPAALLAADPLERIPAETDVVLSVNLRQVFDSTYVQDLLAAPEASQLGAGIEIIRNMTGADVRKDLDRLTVFGKADDKSRGGVRIEGRLQPDKLVTIVKANPGYSTFDMDGTTVHQWFDKKEGRDKFGAFEGNRALTIANSREQMAACLAAAGDKAKSLAARKSAPPMYHGSGVSARALTPESAESHAAWGFIVRPAENGKLAEGARKLFMTSAAMVVDIGPEGLGETFTFAMDSNAKAASWSDVARGAIALLRHQEDNKDIHNIAEKAEVAVVNGSTVTVTAKADAGLLNRMVQQAKEKMAKK